MESRLSFHPRQILCPMDMSELSNLALKYAHVGASVFNASLTVLHAIHFEYPRYLSSDLTSRVLAELHEAKMSGKQTLEAHVRGILGDEESQNISIGYQVIDSPPAEAVMQVLTDQPIELVVMGTHGYGGLKGWVLGSVTERVIHQCPVPVFIVRQKINDFIDTSQPDAKPRIDHILCPCNLSISAGRALEAAAALARRFKARLTVVRVGGSDANAADELSRWVHKTVGDVADIDLITQTGQAAQQIINLSKEQNCDMVVIGVHHKSFEEGRMMGRTTELVMRHAPVPVLAVPYQN